MPWVSARGEVHEKKQALTVIVLELVSLVFVFSSLPVGCVVVPSKLVCWKAFLICLNMWSLLQSNTSILTMDSVVPVAYILIGTVIRISGVFCCSLSHSFSLFTSKVCMCVGLKSSKSQLWLYSWSILELATQMPWLPGVDPDRNPDPISIPESDAICKRDYARHYLLRRATVQQPQ